MPFQHVNFIKLNRYFDPKEPGYAPMFRRKFVITEPVESAVLHVCGLGYAYYYLNGQLVSEDLFTAPVSDYRKTLWYTSYDVTQMLKTGENIFAVICGNGWYNENLETSWHHDIAPWRDNPKFILSLEVNGKRCLTTDEHWKCTEKSPVIYNMLRSGEHFDARLYDPNWTSPEYDDSSWEMAASDSTPPTGTFRLCSCEPIRVDREYPALSFQKMDEDRYIFDFGQNMSGFIKLTVDQKAGDEIVIRYAEELKENGELEYAHIANHYHGHPVQTDRLICTDGKFTWSPKFVYHGFRYVELTGIKNPSLSSVSGLFAHQAVAARSSFRCSYPIFNDLFRIGQMATWSNLFYMPTDCPTREKLGWCNDAQSSANQFLTNFTTERLLEKWLQDIYDAMLPDGQLPGIIPSSGWGYAWGNGPVSDGVLFEVAYQLYMHTGNPQSLVNSLPYFKRYLAFLQTRENEEGDITFGLHDWINPYPEDAPDTAYINSALRIKFLKYTVLAAQLAGEDASDYSNILEKQVARHKEKYLNADGTCKLHHQTAVAMLIGLGIYDAFEPLKRQLAQLVEENDFHHCCGMVGMPYLFEALLKCGLNEYAFRVLNAKGYPGYRTWLDDGATTLYEDWHMRYSKNHHMYSCFMVWMMKSIVGIQLTSPAYDTVTIDPTFVEELEFASGHIDSPHGRISVEWKREADGIHAEFIIPEGVTATFNGRTLKTGKNSFVQ